MTKERVALMLSLARKKREDAISPEELEQLQAMRQEYIKDFREGFSQQLESVYLQTDDGGYQKLQKKDKAPDTKGE